MSLPVIPHLSVTGGHFEVGYQLGVALAAELRRPNSPPPGRTWAEMRDLARPYLVTTQAALPWVHAELTGVAAGSGVELLDLYVRATEEIWPLQPAAPFPSSHTHGSDHREGAGQAGRCSDFAAGPPATADGGIWLAHNNDLSPEVLDRLVSIERVIPGEPRLFTLGLGPFISIGFNEAGLALTGNEVEPNDDKPGVPRLLVARDILAQSTAAQALAAAARPERASSYNNLISHRDGPIVNFEGSATDYELIYAEEGWTVHTNHYCSSKMAAYERDPGSIQGSCRRYDRARELMRQRPGLVTPALLKEFLSDHANSPDSLCRHEGASQTVFWAIIDLTHGAIEYGRGQPCASVPQYFRF